MFLDETLTSFEKSFKHFILSDIVCLDNSSVGWHLGNRDRRLSAQLCCFGRGAPSAKPANF